MGIKQSIGIKFYEATYSSRKDTIFKPVLIACAIARTDDSGYFSPARIMKPLSAIMGKPYNTTNFSSHLAAFASEKRSNILEVREEDSGRKKYRFRNPLIQPYIVMYALNKGVINSDELSEFDHTLTV